MKTRLSISNDWPVKDRRSIAAFTMVEIALCLAIVGFALVAIIGVLPAGLNVQKENREDTILNQDASVWLDALRAGGKGPNEYGAFDDLTNYVDRIVVSNFLFEVTPTATNLIDQGVILAQATGVGNLVMTNGAQIIGLLSTPRIRQISAANFVSNYVCAYVRAINGNATEKAPQSNPDVRDIAFGYKMIVEVSPLGSADLEGIQTNALDHVVLNNLADVRLVFRWPLQRALDLNSLQAPSVGNSRMVFRTQLSGKIISTLDPMNSSSPVYYYFQPRTYAQ